MPAEERITVGLVRGLHGLRGAVRVEVLSDDPGRFAVGSVLFVDGDDEPLTVTWFGESKPGILLAFEGLGSRESADRLRDRYLEAIPKAPLPEGSWYWHQIRGLEVRTTEDEVLGKVTEVFRAGEGEVYIVRGGTRGEVLVPAVQGIITELDPASGHLVVDAVALDLPDKPPRRRRRHELTRADRKALRQRRVPTSTDAPTSSRAPKTS
jgi:16S rRNA processing protein RimM